MKIIGTYITEAKIYKNNKLIAFKDDLTIEVIKHNKHIIIKDDNYNKDTFIGYSIKQAIKQFKNNNK